MGWGAVISGVIELGLNLYAADQQQKAAKKQADLLKGVSKDNAWAIHMENREIARRQQLALYDRVATGRAIAGGSNLRGLSAERYLERLKSEGLREVEWMKRSSILQVEKEVRGGMTRAADAHARGEAAAMQSKVGAVSGAGTALGGALDMWIEG